MKKLTKTFFFILIFSLCFTVAALASGEPSAEPAIRASGEPSAETSGEPSEEPAAETRSASFDVTVMVNGSEYAKVPVTISVTGNRYSFQVGELLDVLGVKLSYDEATDVACIAPEPESISAILMAGIAADKGEASDEPMASDEPAVPAADAASEEPAVFDGTAASDELAAATPLAAAVPRAISAPKPGWYHSV